MNEEEGANYVRVHCLAHSNSPSPPGNVSSQQTNDGVKEEALRPVQPLPEVSEQLDVVMRNANAIAREIQRSVAHGEQAQTRLREENHGLTKVVAELRCLLLNFILSTLPTALTAIRSDPTCRSELQSELEVRKALQLQHNAVCQERDAAEHEVAHLKELLKAFRTSAETAKCAMREAQAVDKRQEGATLALAMKMEDLYIKVAQLPGLY